MLYCFASLICCFFYVCVSCSESIETELDRKLRETDKKIAELQSGGEEFLITSDGKLFPMRLLETAAEEALQREKIREAISREEQLKESRELNQLYELMRNSSRDLGWH